jgi:cap2 methyltransferase
MNYKNENNPRSYNNQIMFVSGVRIEQTGLQESSEVGFIGEMNSLKVKLNEAKTSLEKDFDEKIYYQVIKQLDRVDFLRSFIEKKFGAKHVTKAWMKMYEILSHFKLLPRDGTVTTLHLCEAPGCFIQAFDFYIQHRKLTVYYNWKAQTLTRDEGLTDQYGLIRNHADRWIKSHDDGDISSVKNILLYQKLVRADIVTSDVGLPVEKMKYRGESGYNHQEELLSKLHLAQVTAGLHTLKAGGSLIVKTFTFFEAMSISILYLLTQCFSHVNVTKPVASRPGNSEIYLVCIGYKPVSENILKYLRKRLNSELEPEAFLFEIPKTFISHCIDLQRLLVETQIQALNYTVMSYQKYRHDKTALKSEIETNKRAQGEWLRRCHFSR